MRTRDSAANLWDSLRLNSLPSSRLLSWRLERYAGPRRASQSVLSKDWKFDQHTKNVRIWESFARKLFWKSKNMTVFQMLSTKTNGNWRVCYGSLVAMPILANMTGNLCWLSLLAGSCERLKIDWTRPARESIRVSYSQWTVVTVLFVVGTVRFIVTSVIRRLTWFRVHRFIVSWHAWQPSSRRRSQSRWESRSPSAWTRTIGW